MSSRVTVFLCVTAALLPVAAFANVSPDIEDLDTLEKAGGLDSLDKLDDLDSLAEVYPEFERGLKKYGHHLRHRSLRHPSLLKHAHNVHHRHHVSLDESLDLDADDKVAEAPLRLPGRHPSVEKALDAMPGDLDDLKDKRMAAKEVRGQLEGTVTDAVQHMNDAMSIKRAMSKKETQMRVDDGKLKVLQNDAGRLAQTHDNLVSSLHRMLGPKLMFARERFQKKEAILRKEENAARAWMEKRDTMKASAMELINKKKASHQALLEAETAVAEAKKKEEMARTTYERDRTRTAEEVQSYRYAETRYKAEAQHEKSAKAAALAARESMQGLYSEANEEESKVDQSVMFRKERLRRKIQKAEAVKAKDTHELTDLEQRYKDWKQMQRERTQAVIKKSQETVAASDAYQARQQKVLDAASAKVVQDSEVGDWDGWGNDKSGNDWMKVTDEDDD